MSATDGAAFDLIIFTIATGLNAEMAINTVRIATYEAYARQLQSRGKVFVVADCVTTLPDFANLFGRPRALGARFRKRGVNRVGENLFVYTPVLPLPLSVWEQAPPFLQEASRRILGWCLRSALRQIGADNALRVVTVNDPRLCFVAGLAQEALLVYECLDDYSRYSWETNAARVLERERRVVRKADVIFTTSRLLHDRMSAQHRQVRYFPNAVDFDFFHRATLDDTPTAPGLAEVPRPIVGFMGALCGWYDYPLLQAVIEARPSWSFVFIGWADALPEIDVIRQMPNVYFLGTRKHEELPSFLKSFDVAIMPYDLSAVARAVNPDKMYQYMAAGVPVVATPTPEIAQYREVIGLAHDPEGFVQAIERVLLQDSCQMIDRQVAIAREETWDKRTAQQLEVIDGFLRCKAAHLPSANV